MQASRNQYHVRALTLSVTCSLGKPPQSARKNQQDQAPPQPDAVIR